MNSVEKVVMDAIFGRRSIRSYVDGKEVEYEKIIRLLEAGMAAPSACNLQPWDFIVVTEPETVQAIKDSITRWGNYNAPLIMVVCGVPELIEWDGDVGTIDCSAAIENMLIAAHAMGLGSVWIGGFDRDVVRKLLDIPEKIVPIGVVFIGYPAEQKEPRTKYLEEAVHWQKYEPMREHRKRPGAVI
jgi:nitroreductase